MFDIIPFNTYGESVCFDIYFCEMKVFLVEYSFNLVAHNFRLEIRIFLFITVTFFALIDFG